MTEPITEALDASLQEPVIITRNSRSRHVQCNGRLYRMLWNAWMDKKGEFVVADEETLEEAKADD